MASFKLLLQVITVNMILIFSLVPLSMGRRFKYEDCIRSYIWPQPPPPPSTSGAKKSFYITRAMVCQDYSRAYDRYIRAYGTLPPDYFAAVCNVFNNDQRKVGAYIVKTIGSSYGGLKKLLAGQSCAKLHEPKLG